MKRHILRHGKLHQFFSIVIHENGVDSLSLLLLFDKEFKRVVVTLQQDLMLEQIKEVRIAEAQQLYCTDTDALLQECSRWNVSPV